MRGIVRHPNGTGQIEASSHTEDAGGHGGTHFLREVQGFVGSPLRQDRHEFLSSPSSHRIHATQLLLHQASKLAQGRIASRMTIAIIERFEMIQIQEQDGAEAVVLVSAFQFLIEPGNQRTMIGQRRDRIGRRQSEDVGLRLL